MNIELTERDRRRTLSFLELGVLSLTVVLTLVGCSHAPEYSIFGSFFPVWIFSAVCGLLLAMGARVVIARTAIAEHLAAPVLFYLVLMGWAGRDVDDARSRLLQFNHVPDHL
jgi:YtcA family